VQEYRGNRDREARAGPAKNTAGGLKMLCPPVNILKDNCCMRRGRSGSYEAVPDA
jgi:hypothetical protein